MLQDAACTKSSAVGCIFPAYRQIDAGGDGLRDPAQRRAPARRARSTAGTGTDGTPSDRASKKTGIP